MKNETRIVNCTPHDITLLDPAEANMGIPKVLGVIKKSGIIARVLEDTHLLDRIEYDGLSLPITMQRVKTIMNLPDKQEGTYYIVSSKVALALKGERNDLLITGGIRRDKRGNVLGAISLQMV